MLVHRVADGLEVVFIKDRVGVQADDEVVSPGLLTDAVEQHFAGVTDTVVASIPAVSW